jgi:hypothetical protein
MVFLSRRPAVRFLFMYVNVSTCLCLVKGFLHPTTNGGSHEFRINQHFASFDVIETLQTTSNSILVATIDSDVASLTDNEFRPVFMGGLVVMFGGLISALIVGLIVDSRNLYAGLVADSYAQSSDDEEFWKGLSDEEINKAQDLLRKVKESYDPPKVDDKLMSLTTKQNGDLGKTTDQKDIALFSDYSDEHSS